MLKSKSFEKQTSHNIGIKINEKYRDNNYNISIHYQNFNRYFYRSFQ